MNDYVSPQGQSLAEYLKSMGEKPWTFDWDAILVFDRDKTNILLMQEYIDRLNTDTSFPQFADSEIEIAEGITHILRGLTLDKPRLSFVNANIAQSRADVTLRIIGGKQLQIDVSYKAGEKVSTVTRLAALNAVAGPSLIFESNLATATGSVGKDSSVLLELFNNDSSVKYRFTGVETENEKLKLGEHLRKLMEGWDRKLTRLQLGELWQSDDSILEPGKFGIRTHAAPGANVRGSKAYGDGAVVLFVAMRGNNNGSYPATDKDMLYMLPSSAENFSSNLILGQLFIWNKVVLPSIVDVAWLKSAKLIDREIANTKFRELVATSGVISDAWERPPQTLTQFEMPEYSVALGGAKPLRIYVDGDKIKLQFKPDAIKHSAVYKVRDNFNDPWLDVENSLDVKVDIEVVFGFKIVTENNKTIIQLSQETARAESEITIESMKPDTPNFRGFLDVELKSARLRLQYLADQLVKPFESVAATLDAFRLNNLLFQGKNVVTPTNLNLPCDMTVLGHLSPQRTDMVVTPSEVIVAAGLTQQFKTSVAGSTTWSVVAVQGDPGEAGSISSDGLYTAPSVASVQTTGYRRVIVTATQGSNVSRAMVSLVASDVSVYPSVMVVDLGSVNTMVAGTVDQAAVSWKLLQSDLGSIAVDPDKDPEMQSGYKFTAATQLPLPADTDPLNYYGARLAEVEVTPIAGGSKRVIDILVIGGRSSNYWLTATAVEGGVQMKFFRVIRGDKVEEVPAAKTHWHLYKGDGTLNGGLYTPRSDNAEGYAIVTAFYDDLDSSDRFAYMIIPVPFVSSKDFVQMLGPTKEQ